MSKKGSYIKEVKIDSLVPFRPSTQTYDGKRLEMLVNSINEVGLQTPIIVRPIEDEKYQIISGHNRVKAFKALERKTITANVKSEITDEEAEQIYFDTNLNQQNFNDWKYGQRIEAVKYYDKLIEKTSQQGKRNDLNKSAADSAEGVTSVYNRQKSGTSRDRMSRRLGISTATFSKYRRIIKLPDDTLNLLAQMLDDRIITLGAAYTIAEFKAENVNAVLNYLNNNKDVKFKPEQMKELCSKHEDSILTETMIIKFCNEQDLILEPIRRKSKEC